MMQFLPPISQTTFFRLGCAGRRAARGLPNLQPDFSRAREGDEIHIGMRDQVRAHLAARAGQQVRDARRQAGLDEEFHQPRADDRRLVRGLQDDGVAGHHGRGRHAREDGEGEVPGRNDHAHAARPPVLVIGLARNGLRLLRLPSSRMTAA